HSTAHGERLRARFAGPVLALPIPCYRARTASADAAGAAPPGPRADGRLQLTTVGHIIANKHVDGVIALLAADPGLAARIRYSVAGNVDPPYRATLECLLREHPHVDAELLGWCDEDDLERLMAATDVFANLRDPVFESGSASLARELA